MTDDNTKNVEPQTTPKIESGSQDPVTPGPIKEGNKEYALKIERDKRRALETELSEFKDAQKKASEDRLVEQGKFEDLYNNANTELETLKETNATLTEQMTKRDEAVQAEINTKLDELSEDDRKLMEGVLDGKSLLDQKKLLPDLISKFTQTQDVNSGAQGMNKKKAADIKKPDLVTKYKAAKAKGDINAMVTYQDALQAQGVNVMELE